MSSVDRYRAQNGIANAGGADPVVVEWTKRAAAATGADPVALLATALQESGAQRGRVGDQGTSFGPFQFHRGGALGSHSTAWANSYPAALNRAKEFARLKVHGGVGAAAVQRPRDQSLYASGVDSLLAKARSILGTQAPVPHGAPATAAMPAPSQAGLAPSERGAFLGALFSDAPASDLLSLMQQGQEQGAPAAAGSRAVVSTARGSAPLLSGKVAPGAAKIIGTPYSGTHTLGNWESDNAVDIALPIGTPIYAPFSGTIGSQIGSLGTTSSRFAGLRVHLNGNGNELYFAHLSQLAVKAGQKIKKGQVIGYSGEANGVAHLHLGARNGNPGVYA